jgi:hypothetical protein
MTTKKPQKLFVARAWDTLAAIACAIALVAAITRAPAALVDIQAGPWMNLLAPIGFYLVSTRIAGRGAASIALLLFLFCNTRARSCASPDRPLVSRLALHAGRAHTVHRRRDMARVPVAR